MDLDRALAFAGGRHHGALVTIRRDGRPQISNVVYDLRDGVARISVTADRAKTANLRRDPRAVLYVTSDDRWSYVALDGTAELSPVAAEPGDATCRELAQVFEAVQGGPHPDWDEFHRAMIDDRRLVVRLTPTSAAGVVPS